MSETERPHDQPPTREGVFCYYAVALVDILGQTDALKELDEVPIPCTKEQINPVIDKTAKPVLEFRRSFHTFFAAASKPRVLEDLPREFQGVADRLRGRMPIVRSASDMTMMTLSLRADASSGGPPNIAGLYHVMLASAASLLGMMVHFRTMIRGGIDVGKALELPPIPGTLDTQDIYGAVLGRAYDLERKVAKYPRIVVGDKLLSVLAQVEGHAPTSVEWRFASAMAGHCRELLIKDTMDGVAMLDFLGPLVVPRSGVTLDQLRDLREFFASEKERFVREGKTELAERYGHLLSYCTHSIQGAEAAS